MLTRMPLVSESMEAFTRLSICLLSPQLRRGKLLIKDYSVATDAGVGVRCLQSVFGTPIANPIDRGSTGSST